jgi:DNA-binding winged helix-turn-helix (wHTH) protein
MTETSPANRFRFGVFELDSNTGELRRKGVRVKLHAQPFQVLLLLVQRPGEMLTREEICRELWPDGTFVDYEHGVNSALNRLRQALGDSASNPRFIETLARRGYRFLAPVERIGNQPSAASNPAELNPTSPAAEQNSSPASDERTSFLDSVLATPEDLPKTSPVIVKSLFIILQLMYLGFYVGALANLAEIEDLFSVLPFPREIFILLIVTATIMIPVRISLLSAIIFQAPGMRAKFLKLWWAVLVLDELWSLAPFLLLHHMPYGLALACVPPLVYSPFAQRSLILMGAGTANPL